ncbi:hypothetical protein EV421DRAFT_1738609 [Armillaria borealis]|uniref:Uncharacterized protein n=1 Tax=Armillaria borealis TaxID=47425 RepID=A0AA39J9P1_9AGAR|nr:hypothetical protein EV421DRAFT_1738609 [Armillaria borealis]
MSHQIRDLRRKTVRIYMETTPVLFVLKLGMTMLQPRSGLRQNVLASEMQRYGQWDVGVSIEGWFLYAQEVSSYSYLLEGDDSYQAPKSAWVWFTIFRDGDSLHREDGTDGEF